MTDTPTSPPPGGRPNGAPSSPWRKALREARGVVVVSFLVAITYNIFATTSVPWIREVREHDTTATAVPADTAATPDGSASAIDTAAPTAALPDSSDTSRTLPPPDTAQTGLTAAQRDSMMKATRDSVRTAKAEATRARDSADNASIMTLFAGGKDINTDIARKIYDRKMAVFIDARPEDQYTVGHIVGAINVYAEQWQSMIPELVKIPKDKPIVTYCGGGDECELSHDLAKSLRTFGFKSVVVYTGGIKDWVAKKYPATGPAE